jgi:tetratricopeptide (TPR) repeat protein
LSQSLPPIAEDSTPPFRGRTELHVTASFFGEVVEETFHGRGGTVQIGNSEAMAVPTPEGWPFLAQVSWHGRNKAVVQDHEGRQHPLEPGDRFSVTAGPVSLSLELVPRYLLRRTEEVPVWGSLAWFAVVFAVTLMTTQAEIVYKNRCPWFGIDCPIASNADSGVGGFTAEYLARLLREDYAGEDHGLLEPEERETGEKENPSFYMPAGSEGPVTEMGGAADVAAEEIRTPTPEEEVMMPEVVEEQLELVADDVGTPVDLPELTIQEEQDLEGELAELPAEDRRGWGVQDWYDATDEALEELEIEYMLRASKERLRIDPNDPQALSVLSYYQYLAEDFAAAEATYDKYINLFPDDSAGYNNKALIYKRKGEYTTEEGLYRVALALRPDDVTALNNLAVCLAHQGRYNEALLLMKQLEVLDPGDAYAELHRAKIHAAIGDDELAYHYLQKSLDGMAQLDTLHHIEFRQDIRVDPAFEKLRHTKRFHAILVRYYGDDSPLQE